MWAHGRFLTEKQAATLIEKVDLNKDMAIDYREFLLVVAKRVINSTTFWSE
jgi:hypothetical protein